MKKLTIIGILFSILLLGCNTRSSEEENIQKLLDSQTEMQLAQEESLAQLEQIKDSLVREKSNLLQHMDSTDQLITSMEQNQQILIEKLKKDELQIVSSEKSQLEKDIAAYNDTIAALNQEVMGIKTHLDSVERNLYVYDIQENRSEKRLESGITEIDQSMARREQQKQKDLKRIGLLNKRMTVAEKKIDAYKLERQMYVEERDELLRQNAPEDKLASYHNRIAEMDSTIQTETKSKQAIEQEINQAKRSITETDARLLELREQLNAEFNTKEIIDIFLESERSRLERELEQSKSTRQALLKEQETFSEALTKTEDQISTLEKKMELINNRQMSDLLESQAEIEQEDASLADAEISLLKEGSQTEAQDQYMSSDSVNRALFALQEMEDELDSLNKLILMEKAEIAETRKELSEKKAAAALQRAKLGRIAGITLAIIILGGISVLSLFYFIGKKYSKSN